MSMPPQIVHLNPWSEPWLGLALVFQGKAAPPRGAESLLERLLVETEIPVAYCLEREIPPPVLRTSKHIAAFGTRASSWVRYFVGPFDGQVSYFSDISYLASRAKNTYTETLLEILIGAIDGNTI